MLNVGICIKYIDKYVTLSRTIRHGVWCGSVQGSSYFLIVELWAHVPCLLLVLSLYFKFTVI